MKKKLIVLLLALTLALALTSCGGNSTGSGSADDNGISSEDTSAAGGSSSAAEEDEAQSPDGSEASGGETDEESGVTEPEQPAETQKPTQIPDQKPAEKPAEKPASSGGSSGASSSGGGSSAVAPKPDPAPETGKSVDLSAFYTSVTSSENWPAMMALEGETLDALYPGLSAIQTNQCGAYTAMISAAVGEIALVEVANSADVQAVKDIFQARVNYQVGDDSNPGGAWYPASIEGWKSGSRIVSNGNYVMLVALSEGADSVVDSFNALFA